MNKSYDADYLDYVDNIFKACSYLRTPLESRNVTPNKALFRNASKLRLVTHAISLGRRRFFGDTLLELEESMSFNDFSKPPPLGNLFTDFGCGKATLEEYIMIFFICLPIRIFWFLEECVKWLFFLYNVFPDVTRSDYKQFVKLKKKLHFSQGVSIFVF